MKYTILLSLLLLYSCVLNAQTSKLKEFNCKKNTKFSNDSIYENVLNSKWKMLGNLTKNCQLEYYKDCEKEIFCLVKFGQRKMKVFSPEDTTFKNLQVTNFRRYNRSISFDIKLQIDLLGDLIYTFKIINYNKKHLVVEAWYYSNSDSIFFKFQKNYHGKVLFEIAD